MNVRLLKRNDEYTESKLYKNRNANQLIIVNTTLSRVTYTQYIALKQTFRKQIVPVDLS